MGSEIAKVFCLKKKDGAPKGTILELFSAISWPV
jgi:hypothetical protein